MPLDPNLASVSLIQVMQSDREVATATGFFYKRGDGIFLITNKHVVVNAKEPSFQPDTLVIRVHTNHQSLTQNKDIGIGIRAGGRSLWLEHARVVCDVVAVPIPQNELRGVVVNPFSKALLVPPDVDVGSYPDLIVIAYPRGLYNTVLNLPIVRNALAASPPGVPFNGNPYFLIDARLHPGTSGSPVLTKPTNMITRTDGSISMMSGQVSFLLGIHSATLEFTERKPNEDLLGLSICWFASLVEEILASA